MHENELQRNDRIEVLYLKKKLKRCIAALLACVILTTSTVEHSQIDTYAVIGADDIIIAGFWTLVATALSVNGYSTGQMNSLHDMLDTFISPVKEAYDFLCWCENNPDEVNISVNGLSLDLFKNYLKSVGKSVEDFNDKAINFIFGTAGKMSDSIASSIAKIGDFIGLTSSGGVGKLTSDMLNFTISMLKSAGLQQTVKSDIFSDYVDDYGFIEYKWPQTMYKSTGMSLAEFSSNFEPDYFYLIGYDSTQKKYFAIPLDVNQAYVYGQTSKGYHRLVSYSNPQALCSYFLEYGKGAMTYQEIMDSGSNTFVSRVRVWDIGATSIGGKNSKIVGTGTPTTELIQFPYWSTNSTFNYTLAADFSNCYIMYPMACLDSDWVHKSIDLFYTHDGIIARNECIKYSEVTDLGASASALAGLKLGSEELDIDSALLQAIYNRLNLDASMTSDDIADMVAGGNQGIISAIASSSVNVKDEIEKSNGFLSSIDSTTSKIKDIVTGIPGTIVDGLSSAISVVGKTITGSIDFVGTVVTGIANVVTDIGGILADLLDIIFRAVVKALSACFIPPDDFFNDWKDILENMLEDKLDFNSYLKFVTDIKSITSSKLDNFKVTLFGKECTILTFSWYYKNQDAIDDLIRGVTFLVLVFFNINQSYKMIRGTSLVKVNLYAGRMGGDE